MLGKEGSRIRGKEKRREEERRVSRRVKSYEGRSNMRLIYVWIDGVD